MQKSETDYFVDFVQELIHAKMDVSTLEFCRERLLDYHAVCFPGFKIYKSRLDCFLKSSNRLGPAPIVHTSISTTEHLAAYWNGLISHVAELDDGSRFSMMHPGSPVISALLPLVKTRNLDMESLLRGVNVGYCAGLALAEAMQPSLKVKGYHATGVCGTFAAAIAVAAATNQDAKKLKTTICAAGSTASGILKLIRGASELKPFNSGQASVNGLLAADTGEIGFVAPVDIFNGEDGLWSMLSTNAFDFSNFSLSSQESLKKVYSKLYAACRHAHAPVEAALNLSKAHTFHTDEILKVNVRTYSYAVYMHDHVKISSVNDAKMSTPYSVAAALVLGHAGLSAFDGQTISDPRILKLTEKVIVHVDESLSALVPNRRAAIVEITLKNGSVLTERVDFPRGEPENPLTRADLLDKFCDLACHSGYEFTDAQDLGLDLLNSNRPKLIFKE
jgi:2-methylcitrate dehydratase PrpD